MSNNRIGKKDIEKSGVAPFRVFQRVTSHANGRHTFACVTSVITDNTLQVLNGRNDRFSEDKVPRKHEKSEIEASFPSTGNCAAPVKLFSQSAPPRKTKTQIILCAEWYTAMGKGWRSAPSSGYLGRKEERVLQ